MPKVSLVIPTYNRERVLCDTIQYALNQDFSDYEILVIDQTEVHLPETEVFLKKLPPEVKVIHHRPASLPGARNRGILTAKSDVIIMIDDDVIIESDFITQHLKYYGDERVIGVTGRIEGDSPPVNRRSLFIKSEFLKWTSPAAFQDTRFKKAYRFAGGNFSFRKELALQVGMFDENFIGTAWGEEYDFSLRMKAHGGNIMYNPAAKIFHLGLREGGCMNRARFDIASVYTKSHNMTYLLEKNRIKRQFHFYLAGYIYKQLFFRKEYLSVYGFFFMIKGQYYFLKGLLDGFIIGKYERA